MGKLIFITGGIRSGKSMFAQNLAAQYDDVAIISTGRLPGDEAARMETDSEDLPASWAAYKAHTGLGGIIMLNRHSFFVIDCIGAMVANIMKETGDWDAPEAGQAEKAAKLADEQIDSVIAAACATDTVVAVVTNESGMGSVPVSRAERVFRDVLGRANRKLTQFADEAYFMVSGLMLRLK